MEPVWLVPRPMLFCWLCIPRQPSFPRLTSLTHCFNLSFFCPFWRRSALGFLWMEWCWSWNSSTLAKSWLIGIDSDAGRDWGQEEKGTTEDEMARWHHWLDGHESEWNPGVVDGQGGLACCDSRGHKESDMTERLNWTMVLVCQHLPNFKTWFLCPNNSTSINESYRNAPTCTQHCKCKALAEQEQKTV